MNITTPAAFKAELLDRPFAKFDVGLVLIDAARYTMEVVFGSKYIGALTEYCDLDRGEVTQGYDSVTITGLPELSNAEMMKIARRGLAQGSPGVDCLRLLLQLPELPRRLARRRAQATGVDIGDPTRSPLPCGFIRGGHSLLMSYDS